LALILLAVFGLTAVSWLSPGLVDHARAGRASEAQKVAVFDDVTVERGETRQNVVVLGGDVDIMGTVYDTVVVVGGDLFIGPDAQVGINNNRDETAVVVVFGKTTIEPGALVTGETVGVGDSLSDWLDSAALGPVTGRWDGSSVAGWIWFAVFLAVVAVVIVAIAPKQVAFVRERVRHHFFSSLGWGILGVTAALVIAVLLVVTIIGILAVIPWLAVVLPIICLFGLVAVGAMIGRLFLGRREDSRGPVMLAAVLGVVILSAISLIPYAGWILLVLLAFVGFGATCVAPWAWRRQAGRPKQAGPTGPTITYASPQAVPPSVVELGAPDNGAQEPPSS
jgi:hypothetical protein